jgi:hypothetical protein
MPSSISNPTPHARTAQEWRDTERRLRQDITDMRTQIERLGDRKHRMEREADSAAREAEKIDIAHGRVAPASDTPE